MLCAVWCAVLDKRAEVGSAWLGAAARGCHWLVHCPASRRQVLTNKNIEALRAFSEREPEPEKEEVRLRAPRCCSSRACVVSSGGGGGGGG